MQRLTKYSLLLKAILKKTEDEEQRTDLIAMVSGTEMTSKQLEIF